MGNSDSKSKNGLQVSTPSTAELAAAYREKVQARLESEFDKKADIQHNALSRDAFQSCLRRIEEEFDLFAISGSHLSLGLFESIVKIHPGGNHLMTKSEYASAMGLLFNNCDQSVLISATTQAILKWYEVVRTPGITYTRISDEILVSFFEASWRHAWLRLGHKLSSNACLNGKAETDALSRFADSHAKFFMGHTSQLKLYETGSTSTSGGAVDRTITISVGEETINVPTSFSFVSKPISFGRNTKISYPDL